MEQYRSLCKHTEEVIKNLCQFIILLFFSLGTRMQLLAKNSHLNRLLLPCRGRDSLCQMRVLGDKFPKIESRYVTICKNKLTGILFLILMLI